MSEPFRRPSALAWLMLAVALGLALAPWCRNRHYLRDLFDYGIVLAANGHLDRGEKPYVDFTTPIQAGFLGLNWMIEKAGGGTYAALTLGGAALIAATTLVLTFMLARRWPWWLAVMVGVTVAIAAASQHTILWHNALGVFCLALACWASACAPVLRRSTWRWHALAAAGLMLGGVNKLNFQLVALVVACAWAVRAGLVRQASWRRVGVTLGAIWLVGEALPVAVELAWTGASPFLWSRNVLQLAVNSRAEILWQILSVKFLLRPLHDYYGAQPLPQVGLVGVWLTVMSWLGCQPRRTGPAASRWDRWLVPVAALGAGLAGAALMATNFEIASLDLGAWLVLVTSVWLGFGGRPRGIALGAGLVLPALLLGTTAWWSAWQGQRSQFGFSPAPRREYRPATSIGPEFANLRGLRLPPEVVASLQIVRDVMPAPGPNGRRPVFYGPGLEFLDRYFPGHRERGQPLWFHWGTSYGPAQIAHLAAELATSPLIRYVYVTLAFDTWPPEIRDALGRYYFEDLPGPVVRRWTRRSDHNFDLADSFEALRNLGGNLDSRCLVFDRYPLAPVRTADGRGLLGTTRPFGQVLIARPIRRFRGVAVVDRLPGSGDGPRQVLFKIIVHGASPENVRWQARVELPAGQQSVSVPFDVDSSDQKVLLGVTAPEGGVRVGYREIEITDSLEQPGPAPRLREDAPADVTSTPGLAASLFGPLAWRPQQLVVRNGGAGAAGLKLEPGGEAWWRSQGMTGDVHGRLTMVPGAGSPPFVRVLWCKGARMQIIQQSWLTADRPLDFRVWTAEPGGWIGVMVESGDAVAPVQVRVTSSTLQP